MVYYSVTVRVDPDVNDDWLEWMHQKHVPDVLKTGLFTGHRFCRLLRQDETEGITYSIQYSCETLDDYENYAQNHAKSLQQTHQERYKDKVVAFRTLMEEIQ